MFKGFYNLTSGMITQGRRLDVISNNMTNVATPGFKTDRLTTSTFQEVMWNRVGNMDRDYRNLGEQSWITMPSQIYTVYDPGSLDETELTLDFAIQGDGFFAIQTTTTNEDGEQEQQTVYTRNGNFSLDGEGYLCLPGQGRVLSAFGEPLQLNTDTLDMDTWGRFYAENGAYLGRLGVFAFQDQAALEKNNNGMFVSEEEPESINANILQGMLERSNVEWVREMADMMSVQRAYQSAAEVIKIYDEVMNRATSEVGRLS